MLFNVKILIDLLRASSWTWTQQACERLLASLDLCDAGTAAGRRDFQGAQGLRASLYCAPDGSPSSIEFPFLLDPAVQAAGATHHYLDLIAVPLQKVLGQPTTAVPSWMLPGTTLSVQLREDAAPPIVALVLEPNALAA